MPNVAAGTTASYTFTSRQTIGFTTDPGEALTYQVLRAGATIAAGRGTSDASIGPFLTGDVLSVTAQRGAVDYTIVEAPSSGGAFSAPGTFTTADSQSLKAGPGTPIGPPTVTPILSENGAGVLTGVYEYAYGEGDQNGYTVLGPVQSITVASKSVRVKIGPPRRGVVNQRIYRKNPGDTVFRYLLEMGGGYFQTEWVDNATDATVAASPVAPVVDTTALYNFYVYKSVKYFRTGPEQGSGPADLTLLTADSGYSSGTYCIDAYGPVVARTLLGNSFQSFKTGDSDNHFAAYSQGHTNDGVAPVLRTKVNARGGVYIAPITLSDTAISDGFSNALITSATLPSVTTGDAIANVLQATGAGSSAFRQIALSSFLAAGYTGSSQSIAVLANNVSSNAGAAYGILGQANGTPTVAVGASGIGANGTRNIGVLGAAGATGAIATTLTFPSGVPEIGLAATNGPGVGDIFVGFANNTVVSRITNNGSCVFAGLNSNASTSFDFSTSGKVSVRLLANGNTDASFGTTNNGQMNLTSNNATVMSLRTDKALFIANVTTAPAATPSGGGFLYVEAGVLKYKGPAGIVTTLAL